MKLALTLQTPDALDDAICDAVTAELRQLDQLREHEQDAIIAARIDEIRATCSRWFEHGECVRLEIDTESLTCRVVERAVPAEDASRRQLVGASR